ncbi:MAG TPA: aminotransferase class I/II-fold pyridoxal phosphate-dependent enzyme [Vicinamibacterales bacterium]|nr:aminotransferase class I/II-fold pyridoxal phosphate-dependent enzyme [Vicinamibacterales bacterium]
MTRRGLSTELIHRGEDVPPRAEPVTVPIYGTTTFLFDSADEVRRYQEGRAQKYLYSRYGNPTVVVTEQKLAVLDGAEAALALASGMAAASTILLGLLNPGDELLCSAALYGGTFHLINDVVTRFGVTARFATVEELAEPDRLIGDRTRLCWVESPINPTLRCVDVRRIAAACRARQVVSVLDNTFASPVNQRALDLGVDLAMQSATKYLNGHSDVTGGVVTGSAALIARLDLMRRFLGGVIDPQAAYNLARGLKTLPVRIARHNATALAIARFLEGDRRVTRVYYPGLPSHPDYEVARAQMAGFGGMVCFEVRDGLEGASRVFDRLGIIRRATSLGGVDSLVSLPVLTSHWNYTAEELERAGVTAGMVRLSVGLEDEEDLVADLDQALG